MNYFYLQQENCPVCGVKLNKKNITKHLRKVHSNYSQPSCQTTTTVPQNFTKVMYRCKQCHKLYGKAATAKHLKARHEFIPKNPENSHKYFFTETNIETKRPEAKKKRAESNQSLLLLEQASLNYKDLNRKARLKLRDLRQSEQSSYRILRKKAFSESLYCGVCKVHIKRCNVPKHFKKMHNWNLSKSEKYPQAASQTINEEAASPNEYFNRTKLLSGGGYGLGKSRKH